MASFNRVILLGNIGQIEIKTFQDGNKIANASLATGETYTDRNGNKVEDTQWHNLVFAGKLADLADRFVRKGSLLHIEGRLRYRKYNDKDGNPRSTPEIVVLGLQLCDKPATAQGAAPALAPAAAHRTAPQPVDGTGLYNEAQHSDDLPF